MAKLPSNTIWSDRKRTVFGLPWSFTKYILTDDKLPEKFFSTDPYHRAYIAEITGVYVKE